MHVAQLRGTEFTVRKLSDGTVMIHPTKIADKDTYFAIRDVALFFGFDDYIEYLHALTMERIESIVNMLEQG